MARVVLTEQDRMQLTEWLRNNSTPSRLERRARVVLALADGASDREVARQLGVARQTVALWRRRVNQHGGVATLTMDAPGRGRKPKVPAPVAALVCHAWRESVARGVSSSVRTLARQFGLSPATVHRILTRDPGYRPRVSGVLPQPPESSTVREVTASA